MISHNLTQVYDGLDHSWTYAYDNANHMTSATETTGTSTTPVAVAVYKYDAFGNLIEEDSGTATSGATPSATTRYAVDGWNPANQGQGGTSNFVDWAVLNASSCSCGCNNSSALRTRQIFNVGMEAGTEETPLVRIDQTNASDAPGVYWTLTDRMGSVSYVLNNSDALKDTTTYDAWGNVLNSTGPSYLGMYTWDGYQYDTVSGLYFDHARVYDPTSQRWMEQDPMGFDAGDSNLYRYVNNAPTMATDPSGMDDPPAAPNQPSRWIEVRGEDGTVIFRWRVEPASPVITPQPAPKSLQLEPPPVFGKPPSSYVVPLVPPNYPPSPYTLPITSGTVDIFGRRKVSYEVGAMFDPPAPGYRNSGSWGIRETYVGPYVIIPLPFQKK